MCVEVRERERGKEREIEREKEGERERGRVREGEREPHRCQLLVAQSLMQELSEPDCILFACRTADREDVGERERGGKME